ncbi:unnamed protein product [Urochloa decumbens]|uniref:Fungal lipase-type domain-containing protein n=1 Tax=Urochloa decumbens TaxID=240449 RepID=A0ABC8YXH1_9POAL
MAAASVISSSCRSLPIISHRRSAPPISFQQQPPTGAALKELQRRRRHPSSRHVVASVATTDRWAPSVTGDTDRGSQHAETSGRRSDDDDGQHQQLAARWREIHGSNNWEGLLDPIDDVLRAELIRYGELAQATYDSFDYDRFSPYCGSCRFPAKTFFPDAGLDGAGYDVTRYLYATCNELKLPSFANRRKHRNPGAGDKLWSESGTFIGYVAVSTDEETARIGRRDIAVAWRGTITRLEWVADLTANQRRLSDMGIPCPDPRVKVEMGFAELYTGKDAECKFCRYSAREQALAEVRKLVELYHSKGEEVSVTVTGHSLGSALAMLNAFDIAETGANANAPVCVFSFAGPRVGNLDFKRRFETELGVRALRVVNVHDRVPTVPGAFFNEKAFPEAVLRAVDGLGVGGVYAHLGVPLALDHEASPFLKRTMDISCYHNLEAHLHLLDGFRGAGEGFEPRGRDPALVNKSADFLRDDHMVPPVWYQAENKGMVRTEDGRWVLPPRHRDIDQHPEDTEHHLKQLGLNAST